MVELTERQAQVATLVAEGLREAEIAHRLGITQQTVKNHKQALFHKTGARNSVELTRIWLGILNGGDLPDLVA